VPSAEGKSLGEVLERKSSARLVEIEAGLGLADADDDGIFQTKKNEREGD
jgi:hypothetical protein